MSTGRRTTKSLIAPAFGIITPSLIDEEIMLSCLPAKLAVTSFSATAKIPNSQCVYSVMFL